MLREVGGSSGIIDLMKTSGALLEGHFELASGLHSDKYIQCALLLEDPGRAGDVGRGLVQGVVAGLNGERPQVVVSPALGGIIIGHEVARAMNTRFVFTERAGRRMALRRGFRIGAGEKALVVEDVVTTGGSIREVIEIIEECGAEAVGVAAIVSRGVRVDFGVPFLYLVEAEIENHTPQDCALCKEGVPLVKPGSKRVPAEDQ